MSNPLKIETFEELFTVLDRIHQGNTIELKDVDFTAISQIKVKVDGENYQGEINSDLCYSLVNFHDNLLRLYCLAKYQEENLTRLTDEDRAKIQITFIVEEGCTEWKVDLNDIISTIGTELAKHTIDKMNGTQLTIFALVVALGLVGYKLYDRYCQKEEKKAETAATVETTQHFAQLAKEFGTLQQRSQEMFVEHLKTYNNPTEIKVSVSQDEEENIILDQDEINQITRRQRRKLDNDSKPREVEIESIKKSNDKYIVTCKLPKSDYTFPVNVDTSFIDKEETDLLFEAFKDNRPIYILADFKSYQGKIEKGNASAIMLEPPLSE